MSKVTEVVEPRVIINNAAKCLLCNDVISSRHKYATMTCSCANVTVGGGKEFSCHAVKGAYSSYKDLTESYLIDTEFSELRVKFVYTLTHSAAGVKLNKRVAVRLCDMPEEDIRAIMQHFIGCGDKNTKLLRMLQNELNYRR